MFRIFYWFLGCPADRPGGPWWFRDFDSRYEMAGFLRDLKSSFHAYAIEENPTPIPMGVNGVRPPLGVEIVFTNDTQAEK